MKLMYALFKKVFKIYVHSFLSVHIIVLIGSIAFYYIVSIFMDSSTISSNYVSLLNGMGVLTSFFILVIDKTNLSKLNTQYSNLDNIAFSKKEIRQGTKTLNLIFSLTFSMFFLLGVQYILLFFDIIFLLLLVLLIVNIFTGFIIVLGIWHGLELSEMK